MEDKEHLKDNRRTPCHPLKRNILFRIQEWCFLNSLKESSPNLYIMECIKFFKMVSVHDGMAGELELAL